MVRGLKFWIKIEEGLYYPCSENKGADQLRGYREADLCLCFRICNISHDAAHLITGVKHPKLVLEVNLICFVSSGEVIFHFLALLLLRVT